MLKLLTAAAVAALFLFAPHQAIAQDAPAELVLLDTQLWVNPPDSEGLCMVLGRGQLTVKTQILRAVEQRPATFRLRGMMEDPIRLESQVGTDETTSSVRLSGARYCWSVEVFAPEAATMSMAQRGAYTQTIAVRMTLAPE